MESRGHVRLTILLLAGAWLLASPVLAQFAFQFPLSRGQTVPRAQTGATGSCVAVLDESETELSLYCSHDIASPTGAELRLAAPGSAGSVIFDLGDGQSPIQATWIPTSEEVAELLVGNVAVNVTSSDASSGELRGQMRIVLPTGSSATPNFPLEGEQEVPPVQTDATGNCVGYVTADLTTIDAICTHTVENPTSAGVYIGNFGQVGILAQDLGDPTSPMRLSFDITQLGALGVEFADLYVNITSEEHPDGEIRGQVLGCAPAPDTLCLRQGRFQVNVDWQRPPDFDGLRPALVSNFRTDDSGNFYFTNPENLEFLIKILNGCSITNHFWVFFAGTTDVEFNVTVTDLEADETIVYSNPLGQAANAVTDTSAFATCP